MNRDAPSDVSQVVLIPGNSGCRVEIIYNHALLIRKTSILPTYHQRLCAQRLKQERCRPPIAGIVIPRVVDFDEQSFTMEHLQMLDAVEFMERAAPVVIQKRMQIVFDFLKWEFESSTVKPVPPAIFLDKLNEIKLKVPIVDWEKYFSKHIPRIECLLKEPLLLPVGTCHGDLTFSNMMFAVDDNQVGLIDFLDSFVESPLIDLAKLRQDTRFHWTSTRYQQNHDRGKIRLVNRWLNQLLRERFSEQMESAAFHIIEMLNYLRVAPYSTASEEYSFLEAALAAISNEQEFEPCI